MSNEKYKNKYRIPPARAQWWDYSANAAYFITICTAGRECLFGCVETHGVETHSVETHSRASLQEMQLSPIGEIVRQEWEKSFEIRTELFCEAFVIMPNHIHAILRINVETHGCASPPYGAEMNDTETHGCASPPHDTEMNDTETHSRASLQNTGVAHRPPKSISSFVAGFKSAATKRINEYRNTPKLAVWQPRFHDHIIRDDKEYKRIANYINANPENWETDTYNDYKEKNSEPRF